MGLPRSLFRQCEPRVFRTPAIVDLHLMIAITKPARSFRYESAGGDVYHRR